MILINDDLSTDVCEKATFDEALEIIKQLEFELKNSKIPGIGLCANQIGINKAVAIIRIKQNDPTEPYININLVNPVLIEAENTILFEEGCLSFPGQVAKTTRFEQIIIETDIDDYEYYSQQINSRRYAELNLFKNDLTILNKKRRIVLGANDTYNDLLACVATQHEFSHCIGLTLFNFSPEEIGRNDLCPCGKDKKNKKCHNYKYFNANLNKLFNPNYK